MGLKNPDRIPAVEWRRKVETLWDMKQAGWLVISKCQVCGLVMEADLDVLMWKLGANASIWNRHPRCRRLGCTGRVDFQAKFHRNGLFQCLTAPWPPGKPPPASKRGKA